MDTDTNPNPNADPIAGQSAADAAPDVRTLTWAKLAGYNPNTALGQRRTARRRNVFSDVAKLPVAPVHPVVAGPPLQIDVTNTQNIVIKKVLKGGSEKKTCFVEFAGTTMVLKGGSGDSADHVAHSDFIRKLGLKGVGVPKSRLLNDTEKKALAAHFDNGDWQAKEMAIAMTLVTGGDTQGQLSEQVAGDAPQGLFPSAGEQKVLDDLVKRREDILSQKLDKDAAWGSVYAALLEKAKGGMSLPHVKKHATASTAADRAAALSLFRQVCKSDPQLHLIDLLAEIESGQVAQGLAKLKAEEKTREKGQAEMKAFATSAAGIEAFAGVAAADLLAGMDDRIMTKFNGGNFLFDAAKGELVCIDNAKNIELSLSAKNADRWKDFINTPLSKSVSLEDAIYHRIYGKGAGSGAEAATSAPGNYVDFDDTQAAAAKATIRLTLAKVITSVEADPTAGKAAKDRAVFLKARLELEGLLSSDAPLPAPPAPPAKIAATDKIARAGKSFFTSNKKDKRNDTQAIKDQLRAGTLTAAQARQQLQVIEAAKPSLQNDRRSQKILYLARVAECTELLQGIATDLKRIMLAAPDVLTPLSAAPLCASLRAAAATWRTRLDGDKKMLALFDAAWGEVPDLIRKAP